MYSLKVHQPNQAQIRHAHFLAAYLRQGGVGMFVFLDRPEKKGECMNAGLKFEVSRVTIRCKTVVVQNSTTKSIASFIYQS